jgi:UDP-N-acetylmuramoylalanine--D-glutamate ligase
MTLSELHDKKIAILGFGQEGQSVLKYLQKHKLAATILDQNDNPNYLTGLDQYNVIFRSPGVWRKSPQIEQAENTGSTITSQTIWFFENCPAKIIGITGTKGKGTTCSLTYEILKQANLPGQKIYLTGNIGLTPALEILDDLTPDDLVVFELSSFQLQDLKQSPQIAVCLMIVQDHLDHHGDLTEYYQAKSAISAFQTGTDICIYNADYPETAKIGAMGKGQKLIISRQTAPERGAHIAGNIITISGLGELKSFDWTERKLPGDHNLENIAAAALIARQLGIDDNIIFQTVKDFPGLEHRLELVADTGGVRFYNDSISTVPETTMAAVRSFSEPLHLILGGSNKGLDYTDLAQQLGQQTNIASVALLGETGQILKPLLENTMVANVRGPYTDFAEGFAAATSQAKAGEVVLLSPAAASFGMFKNYADRGQQFKQLVSTWSNKNKPRQ